MARQQAGTAVTAIRGGAVVTLTEAADAFLSSPRAASPSTRRAYAGVLDRLAAELGPARQLAAVPGDEVASALRRLWGDRAPATWNRNRAAAVSWLTWCAAKKRWAAPELPPDAERRKESNDAARALPRARLERLLSRRDVPLREKTLWRMLYETAARASEILGLDVEDLDLEQRRAPVRSKGGDTEFVYWDRHRPPAAPAAAPARRRLAHQRAAVPVRPQARPRAPACTPRHLPAHRPGPPGLRPRPDPVQEIHRRPGTPSAPPLRGDPPRRPEGPAAADHGQDPAQIPAHRHALRQARRRSRSRGHQPARPAPAHSLNRAASR